MARVFFENNKWAAPNKCGQGVFVCEINRPACPSIRQVRVCKYATDHEYVRLRTIYTMG